MSKYNSKISLIETGESLKDDTLLRIKYIVETLASIIPENNREKALSIISRDMGIVIDRLS